MKQQLLEDLKKAVLACGAGVEGLKVDYPENLEYGDFTTNIALIQAKKLGLAPLDLAKKIVAEFNKDKGQSVDKVGIAGPGFINFYLKPGVFVEKVKEIGGEEDYGQVAAMKGQKIMVDFTDPNPFKEFHIGHLMSNTIGESLCRIFEFNGAQVVRVCYQGDVGLHVAKALWGMIQNRKNFPEDNAPLSEKIAFLGSAYVLGSQKYEDEPKVTEEIKEINKKVFEKSDKELNEMYEKGRKWSLEHFDEIYAKLGTKFDHIIPESSVTADGQKIVEEFLAKGVFEKSEGAVIFDGQKFGLHTRVFINSQGLPTYETKDMGLAKRKVELEKDLTASIIVTANEQNDYFNVIFKALSFIYPDYAQISKHIGHGMLRFASGKMSSRKGNVITGEMMIEKVEEMVAEKIKDRNYSPEVKKEIIEKVAIGAIKYSILRQAIGGNIIFDFDKSISFEGDSGPYLQYSYVRAKSIIKKAEDLGIIKGKDSSQIKISPDYIPALTEKLLARFPEIVERAAKENAPHYIVTYLTELAAAFNGWYAEGKIVNEKDSDSPYKVAVTKGVMIVLKNGLNLLGIKVPENM
ncbi:MAG: arginine--tRNA ligase [Candidatus Paceibacterota bacterium]